MPDPLGPAISDAVAAFQDFAPLEPLGPSGQKVVLRGRHGTEDVVVKVPKVPLRDGAQDEETREADVLLGERMRREILAMGAIDNRHVARVIRGPEVRVIGEQQYAWFAEPFYPQCLRALVAPAWEAARVIALLRSLLDGISAIDRAGIVHRDLKPENVALDSDAQPVLLDFGVSFFRDRDRITEPGQVADFTKAYSAPEQWVPHEDADDFDVRTDLFCVGLIAFELLTGGARPFGQCNTPDQWSQYKERARTHAYDRATLRAAGVQPQMQSFIDRLLKPTPSGRFRTLEHARSALEGLA